MQRSLSRDPLSFVMEFVRSSERYKSQYVDRWTEVVENFMVQPYSEGSGRKNSPFRGNGSTRAGRHGIILKDAETHKAIMTYASKLVKAVFGDPKREYVKASPVGWEDAPSKAPTVTRLLQYAFGLPGHYRSMVEAVIDMLLFGTSVVECVWEYQEREMPVRTVTSTYGVEESEFMRVRVPVYDDVRLNVLDIQDFFPDPSFYRIQDMPGVAKRFKMTAMRARAMADSEIYDSEAVDRAINQGGGSETGGESRTYESEFRKGIDQPEEGNASVSDFGVMIGYEYWGEVPWEGEDGSSRRVITVLNGEVVRDDPYPFADAALPFHTFVINPVCGRFYGVSPAEVIRYDQDFTDALKMLIAEAVVRSVHPPIAYDPDTEIDVAKMMRWKADLPIAIRGGPGSIGTLNYNADVGSASAIAMQLKAGMQEASGALGALQGAPGPSREPATAAAFRAQNAMDRPELGAAVLENECLPPLAKGILSRYQQFVEDTEGLKRRLGELPEPYWIGDIMGEFDVQFFGSRMAMTRQEKLQAFDRLVAMASAVPPFAMMIPWQQIATSLIGDTLELPEIAGMIADPRQMMMNMLLSQAQTGASNGNGVAQGAEPAGALPAQMGGNAA